MLTTMNKMKCLLLIGLLGGASAMIYKELEVGDRVRISDEEYSQHGQEGRVIVVERQWEYSIRLDSGEKLTEITFDAIEQVVCYNLENTLRFGYVDDYEKQRGEYVIRDKETDILHEGIPKKDVDTKYGEYQRDDKLKKGHLVIYTSSSGQKHVAVIERARSEQKKKLVTGFKKPQYVYGIKLADNKAEAALIYAPKLRLNKIKESDRSSPKSSPQSSPASSRRHLPKLWKAFGKKSPRFEYNNAYSKPDERRHLEFTAPTKASYAVSSRRSSRSRSPTGRSSTRSRSRSSRSRSPSKSQATDTCTPTRKRSNAVIEFDRVPDQNERKRSGTRTRRRRLVTMERLLRATQQ